MADRPIDKAADGDEDRKSAGSTALYKPNPFPVNPNHFTSRFRAHVRQVFSSAKRDFTSLRKIPSACGIVVLA
ncbi:MAG: hypothetical protein RLZZ214_2361, partial [Verrucomicrobiota bacterium]